MRARGGFVFAGFLAGLALVLVGGRALGAHHPLSRAPWEPACWQLTQAASIRAPGIPPERRGAYLPRGSEFSWDGEVASFVVYLTGTGFARCADDDVTPAEVRSSAVD